MAGVRKCLVHLNQGVGHEFTIIGRVPGEDSRGRALLHRLKRPVPGWHIHKGRWTLRPGRPPGQRHDRQHCRTPPHTPPHTPRLLIMYCTPARVPVIRGGRTAGASCMELWTRALKARPEADHEPRTLILGSSASRRPSPTRSNPNTTRTMARTGNVATNNEASR